MKILKIFAIVVGIHVFALVLIFANPGCSSTTKPAPAPTDTVTRPETPPITVPSSSSVYTSGVSSAPISSPPITFNPDAPAVASSGASGRYTPTRPGTPVAGALVAEPVADVTPATTYTVKSGDSLWSVAKKHHLTVAELAAANSISVSTPLRPNQKLLIPGKPSSPAAAAMAVGAAGPTPKAVETTPAAASRSATDAVKHTVKSGESLSTIARIYGVKSTDIAVANNIADPARIKAGDQLVIPGWQTPGSKSGKASKSAPKSTEPKPAAPVETAPTQAPAQPPPVPVIRIDETPVTPAPRP